jgi:hypothetical protein
MKPNASQTHPGRFAVYFLLMFAGLASAVLGLVYQETLLIGIGAVFIVVTLFAFRSTIPLTVSAWALVWMLVGALVGASFGLYLGTVAEAMVGIIGAAVLGATVGVVLLGGGLGGALGAPVFPGVKVMVLPRAAARGLFFIGAVIGGILGVIGLREGVTTVFGPIGGGVVALGSLGFVVGLFLGNRRIDDTDTLEEAWGYTHEETSVPPKRGKRIISNPGILMCSVGVDSEFAALIAQDRLIYQGHYKNITECQAVTVSDFVAFISDKTFDIVHLFVNIEADGTIEGVSGIEVLEYLLKADAKLIISASSNSHVFNADQLPKVNLVMTLDRGGDKFGKFFKELFELVAKGESLMTAWVKLVPQASGPWMEKVPSTVFIPGWGDVRFIPWTEEDISRNN